MQITLEIPDDIAKTIPLGEGDWLREIAIALFQKELITLGSASRIARMHQIEIYTGSAKGKYGNIYHDDLRQNISTNGRHEGIAVKIDGEELIFDNIHKEGITKEKWLRKFYCLAIELGGKFEIEEIEF